jgi:hypothetical protein
MTNECKGGRAGLHHRGQRYHTYASYGTASEKGTQWGQLEMRVPRPDELAMSHLVEAAWVNR